MKNLLKSIGAAIGYSVIYLLITFIVVMIFSITYGFQTTIEAARTGKPYEAVTNGVTDFMTQNTLLFSFIAGIFTLLCFFILLKLRNKSIKERLSLNPISLKKLWPVLPFGILVNLVLEYCISYIPIPESVLSEYITATSAINNSSVLQIVLATVIMAPVLEEVLFRGLIFGSLQRGMPLMIAIILQAIIFGLMHGQILWVSYATVLGLVLGMLKLRYQSLYAPMLLHFAVNGSNFLIVPLREAVGENLILNIIIFGISIILSVLLGKIIMKTTMPAIEINSQDLPVSEISSDLH